MAINKDLKERAQKTRVDGIFTLKLDEGISLAMLVSFTQDMFPGRTGSTSSCPVSGDACSRRRSSPAPAGRLALGPVIRRFPCGHAAVSFRRFTGINPG